MSQSAVSYYDLLGVAPDAEQVEIKRAYRALLKQVHPDTGGNSGMFRMVQLAYETLSDESRRAAYDRQSGQPTPPPSNAGPSGPAAPRPEDRPAAHTPHAPSASRVEMSELSWAPQLLTWTATGTAPAEQVTPAGRGWIPRAVKASWAAAAVTGLLATWALVGTGTHAPGTALAALLVVVLTGSVWHRDWLFAAPVVVPAAILSGIGPDHLASWPGAAWVLWLAAVTGAVGCAAAARFGYDTELEQVLPEATVREFTIFGTPGSASSVADFTMTMAAHIGADATGCLTMIPGVRVLHRVSAPGSSDPAGLEAGADQVLVCGNKVALVVCRPAMAGLYAWSGYTGRITANGGYAPLGAVFQDVPVDAVEKLLPKCEVRSWVLLASATDAVHVDNAGAPAGFAMGTPQQVVDEIGAWFLTDHAPVVDRRRLMKLARGIR